MWQPISRLIQIFRSLTVDQVVISLVFLYLTFPLVIFFLGWLKPWFAIPFSVLLALGVALSLRAFAYKPFGEYLTLKFLIVSLIGAIVWVLLSGIGGYGHQNWDFHGRNAVFHDLINHSWPVTYDYSQESELNSLFGDKGMLVYYFAYWLPAAVLGKLAGWGWANFGLFLWSVAGVWLTFMLTARYLKNAALLIIPVYFLASGMDIIGWVFTNLISGGAEVTAWSGASFFDNLWAGIISTFHLDDWLVFKLQYSSFTTQLFYVFNQSIPAWLGTLLLINSTERRSLIFIWALTLWFAPLPALGLLPFIGYYTLLSRQGNSKSRRVVLATVAKFKEVFSIQNMVIGTMLIASAIAFFGLTAGQHVHGFLWDVFPSTERWILLLGLFYFSEFLFLGILLSMRKGDHPLLGVTLLILGLLPLYVYGRFNDLAMRASIPALLVLLLLAMRKYIEEREATLPRSRIFSGLLVAIFLIGSVTPLHEIQRSIVNIIDAGGLPGMKDQWKTFDRPLNPEDMQDMGNFVARFPQESSFYRLFLK